MPEVVRIISYGGRNIVWPPYVFVRHGDTVTFTAVDTDVTVTLTNPEMFEDTVKVSDGVNLSTPADAKTGRHLVLEVGKGHAVIQVKSAAALKAMSGGAYAGRVAQPYTVYCKGSNSFAEGNSAPVIIIEPPPPPGIPG